MSCKRTQKILCGQCKVCLDRSIYNTKYRNTFLGIIIDNKLVNIDSHVLHIKRILLLF